MGFTPDDKELLRLLIKEAVSEGMKEHQKDYHEPLENRIDEVRRVMWLGMGGFALLTLIIRLL